MEGSTTVAFSQERITLTHVRSLHLIVLQSLLIISNDCQTSHFIPSPIDLRFLLFLSIFLSFLFFSFLLIHPILSLSSSPLFPCLLFSSCEEKGSEASDILPREILRCKYIFINISSYHSFFLSPLLSACTVSTFLLTFLSLTLFFHHPSYLSPFSSNLSFTLLTTLPIKYFITFSIALPVSIKYYTALVFLCITPFSS